MCVVPVCVCVCVRESVSVVAGYVAHADFNGAQDGNLLASGGVDTYVRLWDTRTNKQVLWISVSELMALVLLSNILLGHRRPHFHVIMLVHAGGENGWSPGSNYGPLVSRNH